VAQAQARRLDGAAGKQWVSAGEADLLKKLKDLLMRVRRLCG